MKPFKFAIFDMDGTLIDSMGYWNEICAEFLHECGIYDDELFDVMKPMSLTQTVAFMEKSFDISITADEMFARITEIMLDHYRNDILPKPGVFAVLDLLQKKGVRMCLASATAAPLAKVCLQRWDLMRYFEFYLSAEEVGVGKTNPDIFYEAAKRLGAKPEETMVFEDSMTAGLTAKNAGFRTTAIYDENGKLEWDEFYPQTEIAFLNWDEALRALS